jgi:hypothetical protein
MLLRCDTRADRVLDICRTLARCSGFLDEAKCGTQLTDALRDQRISRAGIARCAHCLGNHRSQSGQQDCEGEDDCQNCESLLNERDCDVACNEVDYAQRTRTSELMRESMCKTLGSACGQSLHGICHDALAELYRQQPEPGGHGAGGQSDLLDLEESLDLDATVEKCWECTQGVAKALSRKRSEVSVEACSLLVATCQASCSLVVPVAKALAPANSALALCDLKARCVEAVDTSTAGQPPAQLESVVDCLAGDSSAPIQPLTPDEASTRREACFERRVTCTSTAFQGAATTCLSCADTHDCGQVVGDCRSLCEGITP